MRFVIFCSLFRGEVAGRDVRRLRTGGPRSVALSLLLFAASAAAEDLTLADFPARHFPSMSQSLSLTASFYEISHTTIGDALQDRPQMARMAVALFDLTADALLPAPLSDTWLHEEWHRAVMGSRGIHSFDDVYHFRVAPVAIAVSHVRDEDLVRLKREHPADLVRLDEAGVEGQQALILRLEKGRFFDDTRGWHLPLYWMTRLDVAAYILSSTWNETNTFTDRMNREDGTDVRRRDFTGHDFVGWMYDLSRPDEPYAARGPHPSGVGIDRYRKPSQLTPAERSYLRRQGRLEAFNFVDSNLFDVERFRGRGFQWNVTASHLLTSFGNTIDANLFVRSDGHKLFVVAHRYANRDRSFPGLEVQLLDHRVGRWLVSPRIGLWSQPRNQRFDDHDGALGGFGAVRAEWPLRDRLGGWIEVEGKTRGWLAGNESLGSHIAVRFGIAWSAAVPAAIPPSS